MNDILDQCLSDLSEGERLLGQQVLMQKTGDPFAKVRQRLLSKTESGLIQKGKDGYYKGFAPRMPTIEQMAAFTAEFLKEHLELPASRHIQEGTGASKGIADTFLANLCRNRRGQNYNGRILK